MKLSKSGLLAFVGLAHPTNALAPVLPVNIQIAQSVVAPGSSLLISKSESKPPSAVTVDSVMLKSLEEETKAAEQEAKADGRKAKLERKREAFFEYEAKAAAEKEAQIEAAERKALAEALKDKEQAGQLKAMEEKAELEEARALSRQEKIAKQKEIKVC